MNGTRTRVEISLKVLLTAYKHMVEVREMARLYDEHRDIARIVHSTSRGHEAIQLAIGMQLLPQDYVYPYYRDESILLGIGMSPYELMLQLLAKRDDPFSGGRMYYAHPSLNRPDKPKIPFQSSAVGMQAIPATGAAHGIKYKELTGLARYEEGELPPIVVCSLGDGALNEGEVSEALQEAVLHQLPIVYLVQDNGWGISARAEELYAMKAPEYAKGFPNLETYSIDGTDFLVCYTTVREVYEKVRKERRPILLHAEVPLLHHHTSGVRKEWYRDREELEFLEKTRDPYRILRNHLQAIGVKESALVQLEEKVRKEVEEAFVKAQQAPDPDPEALYSHVYAPTPITEEKGEREPKDGKVVVMVDAALHACEEILKAHPEALIYGQDVGRRLGGVFRETATLAKKFGDLRVFNTPIQEAYIIGSTAGMSAVGLKPIVEIQFADYIWPGLNQLFTELSRSYYLSNGKWPIYSVIRVPIGAYGGGGPYHSSSCESVLCQIKGIKVVYPSNAADMKGLLKAAFYDPNPVVILEHKGLYWSKVKGTEGAKTVEPDSEYVIPIGKGRIALSASSEAIENGESCLVITYGMGVHWSLNAAKKFPGQVEVVDLRSLQPYDWELICERVKIHGKVLLVTEEPLTNSFIQALGGRISQELFSYLDAPVQCIGSPDVPGIPTSEVLENEYLVGIEGVQEALENLLQW